MAETTTTRRVSPESDAPKAPGFDNEFNNIAFFSLVDDLRSDEAIATGTKEAGEQPAEKKSHVRTIADLKKQLETEAHEKAQAEKTKELAELLDDPADRRRGLMAIYGDSTVENMSDADIEAFIGEKTADKIIKPPTTPETATTTEIPEPTPRPEGFPTRAEAEAELEENGPVQLGLLSRARLLAGAPGRALWKGYSKLVDSAAQRSERYNEMTEAEKERFKKKLAIRSTVGATVIGLLAYGLKADSLAHQIGSGASTPPVPLEGTPANRVRGIEEYPKFEHDRRVAEFAFDPNDPLDPIKNPARQEYNFGAALNLTSAEAARDDLLAGLKHSPIQLAAAMGNFGLIPNNQGSIEAVTDLMQNNPEVMAANYDKFHEMAMTSPVTLTGEKTLTYGSYSAVNDGGVTLLAYQSSVTDSQPFLAFGTPNGEACFGAGCRQPVDLPGPAAVVAAPGVSQTVGNNNPAPVQNLVGSRPSIGNGTPHEPVPQQPNNPTTPDNPEPPQPPVSEPPVPEPPIPGNPTPEVKDYSGGVPTADGIIAGLNQFLGITPPPEAGNGTVSPNLAPGVAPVAPSPNLAGGADANTDPQINVTQPGANNHESGINRDPQGYQSQQAAQQAQAAQAAANAAANAANNKMTQPGATSGAVQSAINQMGADGRPK